MNIGGVEGDCGGGLNNFANFKKVGAWLSQSEVRARRGTAGPNR